MLSSVLSLCLAASPAASVSVSSAHSEMEAPKNRITVAPVPLLFGWMSVEYERAITPRLSLVVGPQLQPGFTLLRSHGIHQGARVSLGGRYFLTGHAPFGVWTGLEVVPTYEQTSIPGERYLWRTTRAITGLGTFGASLRFGLFTGSAGLGLGGGFMDQNLPSNVRANYPAILSHRGFYPALSGHLNVGMAI